MQKYANPASLRIRDYFITIKNLLGHFANDGDHDKLLILLAVLVTFSIASLETLSRCHEFKRDLLNANESLENKTELKSRFV